MKSSEYWKYLNADGTNPSITYQFFDQFQLKYISSADYPVKFFPNSSTALSSGGFQPTNTTITVTASVVTKGYSSCTNCWINGEYQRLLLSVNLAGQPATITSQIEVVELIVVTTTGFSIDQCQMYTNPNLAFPICNIVYYTFDAYESSLGNTAQKYMAIKISGIQTVNNAAILNTAFPLFVFGTLSGGVTSFQYRLKMYDWTGNVIAMSVSP